MSAPANPSRWQEIAGLMGRPQPVSAALVALFALIPLYLFIPQLLFQGRELNAPEIALDRMMALDPAWSLVYGSLFCAALLPAFVIHQQELFQRTVLAYLMIWLLAFACFIAYPTIGPRSARFDGDGFSAWALQVIYASDHRYNCLPSLHVAQCFLAAFACFRVHRGVGYACMAWAFLVGLSTIYTKQHYVLDVVTGALLAGAAYAVVLRGYRRELVPENERRLAPTLALGAFGFYGLMLAGFWILHAA
jgi:membrane-associated phospholipid phosphatase